MGKKPIEKLNKCVSNNARAEKEIMKRIMTNATQKSGFLK
jgi:hypothetical protein